MKREPILIITAINICLQTAVVLMAVLVATWTKEEAAAVSGVIAASLSLSAAFFARSLVTPTSDPRDDDGNALHREDSMPTDPRVRNDGVDDQKAPCSVA